MLSQLTRWFLPTAERRPQRKSASPRWQNGWSKSSNEYLEPTARETWHLSNVGISQLTLMIAVSINPAFLWVQILSMLPVCEGTVTLNVTVKTSTVKTSVPNVQFPNICRSEVTTAAVSDMFQTRMSCSEHIVHSVVLLYNVTQSAGNWTDSKPKNLQYARLWHASWLESGIIHN